jgi:membrane-associated phospholipid phosphatase
MNWKYQHPSRNFFSWAVLLFLLGGAVLLLLVSKETLFWKLNQLHSYPADLALKYITHVGDGLLMIGVAVVALGLGYRKLGILLILTFLLSGLLAQGLKRLKPEPRPGAYLAQIDAIHKVDGKLLKGKNSFPSGHTTTAFAMFALLAFATRSLGLQIIYFLAAVAVGYSRIYLGQHFFADVWAGALLGFASAVVMFWLFRNKEFDAN